MTSIPADPSMVLGNYIDMKRIKHLQAIAEAQKPEDDANDQLQNLILSNYRFKMLKAELSNMGVEGSSMDKLQEKIVELRSDMASAAVKLALASIKSQDRIEELELEFGQTTIGEQPESPLDFQAISVKKFPLSSDSMQFDVQFFKFDKNEQKMTAQQNTKDVKIDKTSDGSTKNSAQMQTSPNTNMAIGGNSINNIIQNQTTNHTIDGTLVITASCTHRQADIIAPVVMDPYKLLQAWNDTFPEDSLGTTADEMIGTALGYAPYDIKSDNKENKLYLLTGRTTGSSFVGFVHFLHIEDTSNDQTNESTARKVQQILQSNQMKESQLGRFGVGSQFAKETQELLSTSQITSHCSLITKGIIPDIKANSVKAAVLQLQPTNQDIMTRIKAQSEATGAAIKETDAQAADAAKNEIRMTQLDSKYLDSMGQKLSKMDEEANSVFDTTSLMNAFTDYVSKCSSGQGGVPVNFYVKAIDKMRVAKEYCIKYYPNGAQTAEELRQGGLAIAK